MIANAAYNGRKWGVRLFLFRESSRWPQLGLILVNNTEYCYKIFFFYILKFLVMLHIEMSCMYIYQEVSIYE